jgi:hypothetical protein
VVLMVATFFAVLADWPAEDSGENAKHSQPNSDKSGGQIANNT